MRETIALDIDDVLSVTAPAVIDYSNRKWGYALTLNDYDEWWPNMWQVTTEQMMTMAHMMFEDGEVYPRLMVVDGAKRALEHLHNKGYKIIVLTARREEIRAETDRWIEENLPHVIDEVHYLNAREEYTADSKKKTKGEKLVELGANYLVDNQIKHCNAAAGLGIRAVLFYQPWSWEDGESASGVRRAKDWEEVVQVIEGWNAEEKGEQL